MAPYASGTIFLFMGGFILAIAVQRWRLDKRIALTTLKLVGTKAPAIVGGFLLASGVLSMWVSNTATAAMMVPIAMAVLSLVRAKKAGGPIDQEEENFSVAMLPCPVPMVPLSAVWPPLSVRLLTAFLRVLWSRTSMIRFRLRIG